MGYSPFTKYDGHPSRGDDITCLGFRAKPFLATATGWGIRSNIYTPLATFSTIGPKQSLIPLLKGLCSTSLQGLTVVSPNLLAIVAIYHFHHQVVMNKRANEPNIYHTPHLQLLVGGFNPL